MKHLLHIAEIVTLGCCLLMPAIPSFAATGLPGKSKMTASVAATGDTLNLALTATTTTSFISGWEKLGAHPDRTTPEP